MSVAPSRARRRTTSTSVSLKTSVPHREVDPGFVEIEVGVLRVERLV